MVSVSVATPPTAQPDQERLAIASPAGHESDSCSNSTSSLCDSSWSAKDILLFGDVDSQSSESLRTDRESFKQDSSLQSHPFPEKNLTLPSPSSFPFHLSESGLVQSPVNLVSHNRIRQRLMRASSLNEGGDDRRATRRAFQTVLVPSTCPFLNIKAAAAQQMEGEEKRHGDNARGAELPSIFGDKETPEQPPQGVATTGSRHRRDERTGEAAVLASNLPTSKPAGDAARRIPCPILPIEGHMFSSTDNGSLAAACPSLLPPEWDAAEEGEQERASGSRAVLPPSPCGTMPARMVLVSPRFAGANLALRRQGGHVEASQVRAGVPASMHRYGTFSAAFSWVCTWHHLTAHGNYQSVWQFNLAGQSIGGHLHPEPTGQYRVQRGIVSHSQQLCA